MLQTILCFWLLFYGFPSNARKLEIFSVEEKFKTCESNDDCAVTDPRCDGCCGSAAINKQLRAEYEKLKAKNCKPDRVCDCVPDKNLVVRCKSKFCQLESQKKL